MWFKNFMSTHRRKLLGLAAVFVLPAMILGFLFIAANSGSEKQAMRVAAIALQDHYSENPPYGVWEFESVRISEDERLIVDVHVAVIPHATFIKTRNKRIRYSYLKLACPKADAPVHAFLQNQTVWINLRFHEETLLLGACPKTGADGYFTS